MNEEKRLEKQKKEMLSFYGKYEKFRHMVFIQEGEDKKLRESNIIKLYEIYLDHTI